MNLHLNPESIPLSYRRRRSANSASSVSSATPFATSEFTLLMKPQIYRSSPLQPLSPFVHCAEASIFSLRLLPLPPPPSLSDPHPPSPKDPHPLLYPLPAQLTPSPKPRLLKPNPPAQSLHSSGPAASHHHQPSNHHLNTHSHNSSTTTNHPYVAHFQTPHPPPLTLSPTKTTTKPTSANDFPAPRQPRPNYS
jgi:hypothetical protein